jgi:hypothetical protein
MAAPVGRSPLSVRPFPRDSRVSTDSGNNVMSVRCAEHADGMITECGCRHKSRFALATLLYTLATLMTETGTANSSNMVAERVEDESTVEERQALGAALMGGSMELKRVCAPMLDHVVCQQYLCDQLREAERSGVPVLDVLNTHEVGDHRTRAHAYATRKPGVCTRTRETLASCSTTRCAFISICSLPPTAAPWRVTGA